MTRVLVTGAAGFLGRRLIDRLIARGTLVDSQGESRPITEIIMVDRVAVAPPPAPLKPGEITITTRVGDLADADFVAGLAEEGFDSLFHLASLLTLDAERDPTRAFAVNVEALRRLLDAAREVPKVVFTSSIAAFGGVLPETVDDSVVPTPATTYGAHKLINEILIADYSRSGRVDGRSLRLPIVVTRPGSPQASISDRVAGLIREPLAGIDVACPFTAETPLPIISAGAVVSALIRLHDCPAADLPPHRAFNLPALTAQVAEVAAAVARHGATGSTAFQPDAALQAIVDGWLRRFTSAHAGRLGLGPDADLDALIRDHLEHRGA